MIDVAPTDLCPLLQRLLPAFVQANANIGLTIRCGTTYRDSIAQNAAKAAGQSNASAGHSPHNCVGPSGEPYSKAFDFSVIRDGGYVSNGADQAYATAGAIAKSLGLEWGGDWTVEKDKCPPDYDHVQLPDWRHNPGV